MFCDQFCESFQAIASLEKKMEQANLHGPTSTWKNNNEFTYITQTTSPMRKTLGMDSIEKGKESMEGEHLMYNKLQV